MSSEQSGLEQFNSWQWAVGSGQRTVGSKQWAVGNKQWTVGSRQWVVDSKQWAVGSVQCPAMEICLCTFLIESCSVLVTVLPTS